MASEFFIGPVPEEVTGIGTLYKASQYQDILSVKTRQWGANHCMLTAVVSVNKDSHPQYRDDFFVTNAIGMKRNDYTLGALKTVAKACSCKLTPTANMRKPRPGA